MPCDGSLNRNMAFKDINFTYIEKDKPNAFSNSFSIIIITSDYP